MTSSIVFQEPQPGQRPAQRGETDPHAEHTYSVLAFAIPGSSLIKQNQAGNQTLPEIIA
jgi:hypothetical protein